MPLYYLSYQAQEGNIDFYTKTQPLRGLHYKRVDNGWLVWLNGSPHTVHNTYLYLYDTGKVQRVTEGPAFVDIVTFNDGDTHDAS